MVFYYATAAVVIGLISILLVYILKRLQLPVYRIVFTVALGSAAVSLLFPLIFSAVSAWKINGSGDLSLISAAGVSALISLILMFLLSIAVSLGIPDSAYEMLASHFKKHLEETMETDSPDQIAYAVETSLQGEMNPEGNYLEEIFYKTENEMLQETANAGENTAEPENNLEISVDSAENTDKMGIDSSELPYQAVEFRPLPVVGMDMLTLEGCIDEAFRLKESGDYEGAVVCYMDALDKKPRKSLVFWIVLDICILYRTMNQVELAKDILIAYAESYSDLMSADIRDEIERNLLYMM